jgi:hypothetical protein
MHRLRCLVTIGVLAVVVSVVAAGPAVAAKGGNSNNAHACQQGGHEILVDAQRPEIPFPFRNPGDCTSFGAHGGDTSSLIIQPSQPGSYTCPGAPGDELCWGTVVGSGLAAGTMVTVTVDNESVPLMPPVTVGPGNTVNAPLNLSCDMWLGGFALAMAQTTAGATIASDGQSVDC